MTEIDVVRTNPQVDPQLHIWGADVALYLFLGGMAAGLMLLAALLPPGRSRAVRLLPFAAAAAVSLGMLMLFLDLEHKLHVYRLYLTLEPTSPISWGAWILLGIYPATLLAGLGGLTEEEAAKLSGWGPVRALRLAGLLGWARRLAQAYPRGLRVANAVLGVGLGTYTGILLGTLGARALWNSAILGPLFLISGFSTGAAFLLLWPLHPEEHHRTVRFDLAAIALEAGLMGLFLLALMTGGSAGAEAGSLLLGGRFTAVFWSLVVVAGLLLPFLIEALEVRKLAPASMLAPALVLVGGFTLRWVLVTAGQA